MTEEEIEFEWDEINLRKLLDAGRGITPALCDELKENSPKFFPEAREGKTADHWMIAPDDGGRFWTIVVVNRGGELWRPISGWPSTNRQVRQYEEAS